MQSKPFLGTQSIPLTIVQTLIYQRSGRQRPLHRSKDRRSTYAFTLAWPGKELLLSWVQPRTGSNIYMLGGNGTTIQPRGLTITIPEELHAEPGRPGQNARAFQIESVNP
jgi:hypothetical protein